MTQYVTWQHYWYYSTRYIAVRSWSARHPSVHYRRYLIHHVTALLIQTQHITLQSHMQCKTPFSTLLTWLSHVTTLLTWLSHVTTLLKLRNALRCSLLLKSEAPPSTLLTWLNTSRDCITDITQYVVLQSTIEVQDTPQSGLTDGQCANASVVFRYTYIHSCTHTHLHVYLNIQRYWVSAIYICSHEIDICSDDIEICIADAQCSAWNMHRDICYHCICILRSLSMFVYIKRYI